jgi:hypothetical protein
VALDVTLVQADDLCSDSSSITGQSELGLFGVKLTQNALADMWQFNPSTDKSSPTQ